MRRGSVRRPQLTPQTRPHLSGWLAAATDRSRIRARRSPCRRRCGLRHRSGRGLRSRLLRRLSRNLLRRLLGYLLGSLLRRFLLRCLQYLLLFGRSGLLLLAGFLLRFGLLRHDRPPDRCNRSNTRAPPQREHGKTGLCGTTLPESSLSLPPWPSASPRAADAPEASADIGPLSPNRSARSYGRPEPECPSRSA